MKSCLVVDDSRVVRKVACRIMSDLGFATAEAEDGITALEACRFHMPEMILLDWNMPNMTGIDLLRAIRAEPKFKGLPVLMVTAENNREQIVAAAQAGVNGYIVKPFTAITLREKLEKIFERLAASGASA